MRISDWSSDVCSSDLSGENASTQGDGGICFLVGKTQRFDAATLASLYPDRDAYIAAVRVAAQDAVDKGFVLGEDVQLINQAAEQSGAPCIRARNRTPRERQSVVMGRSGSVSVDLGGSRIQKKKKKN